ncbi:MAG: LON peptidase substrate-binding domain-containing protein [Alphaproteobacteria bacterium]
MSPKSPRDEAAGDRPLSWGDLPQVLPVFPLPGVLLLPRGQLPLHIFEPRYRALMHDALATDRLIGMIQPKDPNADLTHPELSPVGCAGRITEWKQTEDGRYFLVLHGMIRFRIARELPLQDGYRRVEPDFVPFAADLADPPPIRLDRDRIIALLKAYLAPYKVEADWSAVAKISDANLVNVFAHACPFDSQKKQALLEAADTQLRADLLVAMLEIAIQARADGGLRLN